MEYSIQTYPFAHPSSWRDEWWFSVWPIHPGIQERRTNRIFHSRILRLQQEIIISGETLSLTRLLFQYIKVLSKSDKIKSFIAHKMTDLITFLDNNGKSAVYAGVNIHRLYHYSEMIGYTTTLITSGQISHHLGHSFSTNNYTATHQPVIAAHCIIQKIICGFCGSIGHKSDAWIILRPKLLPQSLRRKMNQFNTLCGDEPTDPPRECNSQPP